MGAAKDASDCPPSSPSGGRWGVALDPISKTEKQIRRFVSENPKISPSFLFLFVGRDVGLSSNINA
jgi:hypothetical protein